MSNVTLVVDADTVRYLSKIRRMAQETERLPQAVKRAGRAQQEHNQHLNKASGTASSVLATYGAIAGAITSATAALRLYHAEQARGADALRASANESASIAQIARSPEQYLQATQTGLDLAKRYGMDPNVGRALWFQLSSQDMLTDANMRAFGEASAFLANRDPRQVAEGIGKIQAAFGTAETGTARATLNKMLAASGRSVTTLEGMMPAVLESAELASRIGTSDEELLGLTAILSRSTKSADSAGTQLAALADLIGVKGHGGGGILAGVSAISQDIAGMDDEKIKEYFGRKEARLGFFGIQKNLSEFRSAIADIRDVGAMTAPDDLAPDAAAGDRIGMARQLALLSPEVSAAVEEARLKATEAQRGQAQLMRDARHAQQMRQMHEDGSWRITRMGAEFGNWFGGMFDADEDFEQVVSPRLGSESDLAREQRAAQRRRIESGSMTDAQLQELIDATKQNASETRALRREVTNSRSLDLTTEPGR